VVVSCFGRFTFIRRLQLAANQNALVGRAL